jgi:hypothetical protein
VTFDLKVVLWRPRNACLPAPEWARATATTDCLRKGSGQPGARRRAAPTHGGFGQLGGIDFQGRSREFRTNRQSVQLPMKKALFCAAALSWVALHAIAQTTAPTPAPTDARRAAEVDLRGDQGMGFSHDMTRHHFHLSPDGGAIEVESNSPNDDASKAAIRRHMQNIASLFAQGDFSLPMFIHDTVPPGVEVMKRLKDQIAYIAENTAKGAQVRIAT